MRISARDILRFAYCPALYWEVGATRQASELSIVEEAARLSILSAEQRALDKDSLVAPLKLMNTWDKIWWPLALSNELPAEEIEKASRKALIKFNDYCKYDISTSEYTTMGIDIKSEVSLPHGVLEGEIDLIKVRTGAEHKEVTLIDFGRKNLPRAIMSNDLAVLANVHAFSGLAKQISYICVDLSEENEKLRIAACSFDREDFGQIARTIDYVSEGIYKKINYRSTWLCEECDLCSR